MYYLHSRDGLEVDLVIEEGGKLHLFEIKTAQTITPKHAHSLKRLMDERGAEIASAGILSCTSESYTVSSRIANYAWKHVLGV